MIEECENKNNKWYLLYTKPRSEKKVNVELELMGYETFLPLHKTLKQWSDRKKWVEVPLFNSYLFIKTNVSKHFNIVNTNGIVRFVNFEKKPVIVQDFEINFIKKMLNSNLELEVVLDVLQKGTEIEIIAGPMIGTKGYIVEYRSKKHVMINIESIQQNVVLNVPINMLKALH